MLQKHHRMIWISILMILTLILAACPAPAPTAPEVGEPEPAPAEPSEVPRNRTLIFENISVRVPSPENMNIMLPGVQRHNGLQQIAFESLFYYNYETGEIMPWQAEGFEYNDDFTEVIITLREGVEWNDGEPFTADDVVFTINLLKEHGAAMIAGEDIRKWVDSVEAVDARTVRFHLSTPNPRFVFDHFGVRIYAAPVYILPKHVWEGRDPTTFTNFDLDRGWPVTTGPYRLIRSTTTETVWARNDDWWAAKTGFKDLPAPERVLFLTPGSEERRAAMGINNELDTFWLMGRSTFETVKARNPNIISWYDDLPYAYLDPCPRFLGVNTMIEPFDDPEIRWALSYAIDRQQVVSIGWEDMTFANPFLMPGYPPLKEHLDHVQDLFQSYNTLEYNPDKVVEIMTGKGYQKDAEGYWVDAGGNRISMNLVIRAGEADQVKMAPVVTELLSRAGFDASFQLQEVAAFTEALDMGTADSFLDVACGSVRDPYRTMDLYHSRHAAPLGERATGERSRWSNPEYDAIVDQMALTPAEDPELGNLFRQALEIWLQELPAIPLVEAALLTPFNSTYWTNWPNEHNNYIHPGHWWASAIIMVTSVEPTQ